MYRVLVEIADDKQLLNILRFKGGTCAAMLGWLDRFSIDLDFDFIGDHSSVGDVRSKLEQLFKALGLEIKDRSDSGIQYFLKYAAPQNQRNSLKVEASFPVPRCNQYQSMYFSEIERTLWCQSRECMFANKLVAVLDRWAKHHSLAGRDIYDIHYFFINAVPYLATVIEERRGTDLVSFFSELRDFIKKRFNSVVIQQDINMLLPHKKFKTFYKHVVPETVRLIDEEMIRLKR